MPTPKKLSRLGGNLVNGFAHLDAGVQHVLEEVVICRA
jgi:hypothetical protein